MDLPSSKLSWHKRFFSGRSGSCPSSGARVLDQRSPLLLAKQAINNTSNSGLLSGVCQVPNIIILCDLESVWIIFGT
jgi:hypothetical protein